MLAAIIAIVGNNCVRIGGFRHGEWSRVVNRGTGVPEGSVLAPLLFAIAISPLAALLNKSRLGISLPDFHQLAGLLFVDDITLASNTIPRLRGLTQIVLDFAHEKRWVIHPGKTVMACLGPHAQAAAGAEGGTFDVTHYPNGDAGAAFRCSVEIATTVKDIGFHLRPTSAATTNSHMADESNGPSAAASAEPSRY